MTKVANSFLEQFNSNVFIEKTSQEVVEKHAEVSVWHSYASDISIDSVLFAGADDVIGESSGSLAPQKPLIFRVSLNQMNEIAMAAVLGGQSYSAAFEQQVATLVSNSIDWSSSPTITLSYLTEVIESFDGTEQRISVRDKPRLAVSYQIPVLDADRYSFESDLLDATGLLFVPLWPLQQGVNAAIGSGDSKVEVLGLNKYLQSTKHILITDGVESELVEVESATEGMIRLIHLVKRNFSSSAILVPVVVARHADESSTSSLLLDFDVASMTFHADEVLFQKPDYTVDFDTFYVDREDEVIEEDWIRTYYTGKRSVFPFKPDRASDVSIQYQRLREIYDTQTGARSIYDRTKGATRVFSYSFRFFSESERQRFEDFADLHKGAQKDFYFEGPGKLFDLLTPITTPTKEIIIKYQGLSKRTLSSPAGIAIKLYNETTIYNSIKSVTDNKDGTETVTLLDEMQNLEVEYIAPLYLGRFESDDFTYTFDTSEVSSITKNIRQIIHADTTGDRIFTDF